MSNQAITWALSIKTPAPAFKVLLIALANYADEHGKTYPSIKRLSAETDQSPTSVKRNITKLIEMGLVTRHARGDVELGGRMTNMYVLNMGVRDQIEPKGLGTKSGGVRDQIEGGLGPTVVPEPEEPKEPKRSPSTGVDDTFAEFWRAYPRKVSKGQAVKAWRAAVKKAKPETIIQATEQFAAQCNGVDRQFIAHASTWLTGERWADEEPMPTPRNRSSPSVPLYQETEAPDPDTLPWKAAT